MTRQRTQRRSREPQLISIEAHRASCGHGSPCGCSVATDYQKKVSCCIKCPFSQCVFDTTARTERRSKSLARQEQVVSLYKEGIPSYIIAQTVGITKRTVFRLLREERKNKTKLVALTDSV